MMMINNIFILKGSKKTLATTAQDAVYSDTFQGIAKKGLLDPGHFRIEINSNEAGNGPAVVFRGCARTNQL